jgi:hypothetical protein
MSNALVIKDHPNSRERISKRLKSALDMMVWPDEMGRTLDYVAAGRTVNISARSMRRSIARPVVRMYLRTEAEVFRATLNAKTLPRLAELGWQNSNMNAAVNAVKAIRGEEDEARSTTMVSPRLTIVIRQPEHPAPAPVTIEHQPEPELGSDPHDPCRELAPARFHDPTDPTDR